MTQQFTPAQLEAWAGLGPWVASGRYIGTPTHMSYVAAARDENGNWSDTAKSRRDATLIAAAPDLARLVLERDAEIARLRSEVRLCHMQVESAYKELGRATAKVKAWEEIVCLDPSSDPFKVVMSDDWVEQEQVKVQIPSVEKLTTLLNELAAARQAMKETSDE